MRTKPLEIIQMGGTIFSVDNSKIEKTAAIPHVILNHMYRVSF
jgi:hypothetical protein